MNQVESSQTPSTGNTSDQGQIVSLATTWPIIVRDRRIKISPEFTVEDAALLMQHLIDNNPEYLSDQAIKVQQALVEEVAGLIFQSNDFKNAQLTFTFFGDLIEFKNSQFGCEIELPSIDIKVVRPQPVTAPTVCVTLRSANAIREAINSAILEFDQFTLRERSGLVFLSAVFNGALLDGASQTQFLNATLKPSCLLDGLRRNCLPNRMYFFEASRGWVLDPITQGLIDRLSLDEANRLKELSLCDSSRKEKAILQFLVDLRWFFDSVLKMASVGSLPAVKKILKCLEQANSRKSSSRKSSDSKLMERILASLSQPAYAHFAFHLSPVHLQVASNRFNTTCLEPSLYYPSSWLKHDEVKPQGGKTIRKIQKDRLLHSDKDCASRAFNLMMRHLIRDLRKSHLVFVQEQVLEILVSGEMKIAEDIAVSELDAKFFSFLVSVASSKMAVGQKQGTISSITKSDIHEFINFLSLLFCSFPPAMRSAASEGVGESDESDPIGLPVDLVSLDEQSWVDLIEEAYDFCPKNKRRGWLASVSVVLSYLQGQHILLDLDDDFEFNVLGSHLGYYGARAHYAPYEQVLLKLIELKHIAECDDEFEEARKLLGATKLSRYAFFVGVLCLHLGLRLREAVGLKRFDVQWFDQEQFTGELIIRPSHFRTLKSGQAKRRLPLSLIPFELREELFNFWNEGSATMKGADPLFGQSTQIGNKSLANALSRLIVKRLRTDDALSFMTVHSLRHIALNNIWAVIGIEHGWLLPEVCLGTALGEGMADLAAYFETDLALELEGDESRDTKASSSIETVGENAQVSEETRKLACPVTLTASGERSLDWRSFETAAYVDAIKVASAQIYRVLTGRKLKPFETPTDAYALIIKFAGHLSPQTSIHTYLHFLELAVFTEVQRGLLAKSIGQGGSTEEEYSRSVLSREDVYSLFGVNKDWVTRRLKNRPPYFSDLQWLALQG